MSANTHDLGDLVRVYTATPFTDVDTGTLIDPDTVFFSVRSPIGVVTTYTYGSDIEVVRLSVGNFHLDIDANLAGTWFYRIWSTGDGQAAEENRFFVRDAFAR